MRRGLLQTIRRSWWQILIHINPQPRLLRFLFRRGPITVLNAKHKMAFPYIPQDANQVNQLVSALESSAKDRYKKSAVSVKKTRYDVKGSDITVDSWRMQDWDYKRRELPTYARGLFTTRNRKGQHEIAVRGYDKFFNVDEVNNTKWGYILKNTKGPYELTLKENGCIIFISGLEDGTLLVCSKHSTGDRSDIQVSHASAGESRLDQQLAGIGKTRDDLARELYQRNVTAVAELCDDSFEEHILAYGPDKAGLYLHGMNLNLPEFTTYPSFFVQEFADQWAFRKTGLMVMEDVNEVKTFLEEVAETGAHDGRDVEGFVIRCKMTHDPLKQEHQDWFFKFKFEEPYLMYRQWRECTKALIAGRPPKFRKHQLITEEYLNYAKRRIVADPKLGKLYNENHGIIALRDDFLKFKNINGADAANMDDGFLDATVKIEITGDVILCPIATIGCGKTTLALALCKLFDWGHIQNDNISGKGRPPRFTKAVLGELKEHAVVFADRNNAQRHERRQILTDVKQMSNTAQVVCLNFRHEEDSIDEIRRITQERVLNRGDNHQTIHAASDKEKYLAVMEGFIGRYERCSPNAPPDNRFDLVINLDPAAGTRKNLETTIAELNKSFPNLIKEMPTAGQLDAAMEYALGYQPAVKHTLPDRGKKDKAQTPQIQQPKKAKKPQLEYMGVNVPAAKVNDILEKAFAEQSPEVAKFYLQLKQTRRVQPKFHVTLMHRVAKKEHPDLWERYNFEFNAAVEGWSGDDLQALGECEVHLERVSLQPSFRLALAAPLQVLR